MKKVLTVYIVGLSPLLLLWGLWSIGLATHVLIFGHLEAGCNVWSHIMEGLLNVIFVVGGTVLPYQIGKLILKLFI